MWKVSRGEAPAPWSKEVAFVVVLAIVLIVGESRMAVTLLLEIGDKVPEGSGLIHVGHRRHAGCDGRSICGCLDESDQDVGVWMRVIKKC
jgi:hypothetical protein